MRFTAVLAILIMSTSAQAANTSWQKQNRPLSEMTDESYDVYFAPSVESSLGSFTPGVALLTCTRGRLFFSVGQPYFLPSPGLQVQYRADKDATHTSVIPSGNIDTALVWNDSNGIGSLIGNLKGRNKVSFEYTVSGGQTHVITFGLKGFDKAANAVLSVCKQ